MRFTIIDPMHNLFTGTAKHIWVNEQHPHIKLSELNTIQNLVDSFNTPSCIGRIPHKISSNFSSFTADQWKNWVLYFSIPSLRASGCLTENEIECWRLFVLACSTLCTPAITIESLNQGHSYLIDFASNFERIYGKHLVTPNIHIHRHIKECITDYGPVYGFWLFGFERFNGMLGNYHTNQKAIEIQLMRRFLDDATMYTIAQTDPCLTEHNNILLPFFCKLQ